MSGGVIAATCAGGLCTSACPAGFNCLNGVCGCGATDANCNAGAPAGTFHCTQLMGADRCTCNNITCAFGQRCIAGGVCG